jgi:glyoxylase-like metal-dependent hydrolase (beta-lactamase superfamily II)
MHAYEKFGDVYIVDVSPGSLKGIISSFIVVDNKVTVIEPGPAKEYSKLNKALSDLNLRPEIIVATHVHLDHAGSTGHLLRDYPNSIAYIHPKGVKHVVDPSQLWEAANKFSKLLADNYGKPISADEKRVLHVEDYSEIKIGYHTLKFVYTPGHASHHMSILLYPENIIFTGDSAGGIFNFKNGKVYAITSPTPFKPIQYLESLEKMKTFNPKYIAPTHYGIHDNGTEYLKIGIERTKIWLDIISDDLQSGIDDVEKITEHLMNVDEDFRKAVNENIQFFTKGYLLESVMGMINAIKNGDYKK